MKYRSSETPFKVLIQKACDSLYLQLLPGFIPVSPHDEFAPTEFAPTSTELDRVRPQPGRVRPQSSRVRPQPSRVRPQQDRVRPQTFIAYS